MNSPPSHVGSFKDEQDPQKLILLSYAAGCWDLLIIPPETGAAGARLLSTTATPASLTASGLMTSEDTTHDAREMLNREEEWETDGGAASATGVPIEVRKGMQR
ncbi:hypothetical protein [Streptomyces sp. NBC_00259]|uniref:hypothetical protein n=1 Tax=Streptomyces sp. NBC_00259 TaxID=2903643 RepID=UPI002E2A6D62|nr:hypothetical protein [Streptomyces sp. NBC_00259]